MAGYAQFDSTLRQIRLYDNDDNLLASSAVNSLPAFDDAIHTAEVSYVGGVLSASMDGVCVQADCPDSADPFVYLGSDGGTVHFDSFSFAKGRETDEPKDGNCSGGISCPPDPCAGCDPTDPPGALIADLSEFALTSRECLRGDAHPNHCADLVGEYVLIPNPTPSSDACFVTDACCRGYLELQFSSHCCNSPATYTCLKMGACIVAGADPSKIRWVFSVAWATGCSGLPDDPVTFQCLDELGATVTAVSPTNAVYFSEDFNADECAVFPRTMTKDSEHISCPCGGTFPDTLILDSAS